MQPSQQPVTGTASNAQDHPIDFAHLDQQTFGDRDLQGELLQLFAAQAQSILKALGASLDPAGSGRPRAADLLHTLCGSARAVGSWQVAAEAEAMERGLRQPAPAAAGATGETLASLGRSVGQVCAAIDDMALRQVA